MLAVVDHHFIRHYQVSKARLLLKGNHGVESNKSYLAKCQSFKIALIPLFCLKSALALVGNTTTLIGWLSHVTYLFGLERP